MIPMDRIKLLESREYSSLNEEELLIWQYWTVYKESNLWHEMMLSTADKEANAGALDTAFNYAKKGKDAALKALNIQAKIMKLWCEDHKKAKQANFEEDNNLIKANLADETETINVIQLFKENKVSEGEVINLIKGKKEVYNTRMQYTRGGIDAEKVNRELQARGLKAAPSDSPKVKIDKNLKILDNLFWTNKISEKEYNKRCKEMLALKTKLS